MIGAVLMTMDADLVTSDDAANAETSAVWIGTRAAQSLSTSWRCLWFLRRTRSIRLFEQLGRLSRAAGPRGSVRRSSLDGTAVLPLVGGCIANQKDL